MIIDLGLVGYQEAYRIQRELVTKRKFNEVGDSVIVAEHYPVFTIGRTGSEDNLLISKDILRKGDIEVLSVDRGGDITFHGPGQIVLYPIIDLNDRIKDLHRYLRELERVVINFLKEYHISGERVIGRTGVWIEDGKIASIGIGANNWITYHGLSINVNVNLRFFRIIYPCGLRDAKITNLNKVLNRDVSMAEAKGKLLRQFQKIFSLEDIGDRYRHAALA